MDRRRTEPCATCPSGTRPLVTLCGHRGIYALACAAGSRGTLPRLLRRWREEQGRALAELFERAEEDLRALLFPPERALVAAARALLAGALDALAALEGEGIRALSLCDEAYPQALKERLPPAALPLLFFRGDLHLLRQPGMAVLGARDAAGPSVEFARAIAGRLAAAGCNVISGFARGVDRAAFDGAAGTGRTTIVAAQGIRAFARDWPGLARRIDRGGRLLCLSQFLPDAPWARDQAMARNVTIYALADAIVVAAARTDGGTWHAARDGLRRGRPVFVRRPPPHDRSCPGNARLIAEGATPLSGDADAAAAELLLRFGTPCSDGQS